MLKLFFRNELDVSNFSEEFTTMPPTDSPAVVPPNYDKIFKGYSYVAPTALSNRLLDPVKEHDEPSLEFNKQHLANSPFFQNYDVDFDEDILGDGSFSSCRKCTHKATGKEYAVKIVRRTHDCTQEVNLLRACQGHPNIVTLHEFMQDESYNYLVLEYLKGGELFDR